MKNSNLFVIGLGFAALSFQCNAQTSIDTTQKANAWKLVKKDSSNEEIVTNDDFVSELPEPPGGYAGYQKYLEQNIRYPEAAKKYGVQGKVYISLVIHKDGSVSDVCIKKDNVGSGCGEEAIRVIQLMPKWKPAKTNGVSINYKYVIPVTFVLKQ
jgi:TonB family protein